MPSLFQMEEKMKCPCGAQRYVGESGLVCSECDAKIVHVGYELPDYIKAFPNRVIMRGKESRKALRQIGGAR